MNPTDSPPWLPGNPPKHPTLFGLPENPDGASIHILPVPSEATCSYRRGTGEAPSAILRASHQLDLFDPVFGEVWQGGIHLEKVNPELRELERKASLLAAPVIQAGGPGTPVLQGRADQVNELLAARTRMVEDWTRGRIEEGRIPAVLGGDHSSPLGAIRAQSKAAPLTLLMIDAHLDLREGYLGFHESHASILWNVLGQCGGVEKVVALGIRDFSREEWSFAREHRSRIHAFPMIEWERRLFEGETFAELVDRALSFLRGRIWVSFDIDGLDPSFCPHTGTPVPGGFTFGQAAFILRSLPREGCEVVGFDLCEVAGAPGTDGEPSPPEEWDANVGARILYKLCGTVLGPRIGRD